MSIRVGFLAFVSLVACTSDDGADTTVTETAITGRAVYRDATTDHAGTVRHPATPPPQEDVKLRLRLEGTATIRGLAPDCLLDPAGRFEARYAGTLAIGENGACTGSLADASTELVTGAGCVISDLEVGLIDHVVVRAELAPTTSNCETYCDAHGRAEAEQACTGATTAAECRATYAADAAAACKTGCMQRTHGIVAESTLSADAFDELDAGDLRAAALGELAFDLTFDHIEPADGRSE
ncbi:MAG: hypothetical protein F9K40_05645 [Kofleriaceae bacterium]|nr:MAG: hypothetical protein F9K40_05645 [Kofleriaceae bacterium]MBZ0235684.1 hypothetical protein [Kofleriaceae bacterium]